MDTLSVDIETFSEIDLKKSGVYPYAEKAELLLFGFSLNDDPVEVIDCTAGSFPREILGMLYNPKIVKTAWNAQFERVVLSTLFGKNIPVEQWDCTMVRALMAGMPASLDQCAAAFNSPHSKMKGGTALMNYFCKPCKPTKANGGRTRNLFSDAPDKAALFKQYNHDDVVAEKWIRGRLV